MTTMLSLSADLLSQALVIVYPGVFVFWFIMHSRIERWRKVGKKAYWIAALGWPATAIPLLVFRQEVFAVRWTDPGFWWPAGILLLIAAAVVSIQAGKEMPLRTLIGLPELEPHKNRQPLLDKGIYRRTRNPIYFVHWLAVLAAATIAGYAANWIFFAIDCVLLPLMIRAEERELIRRYGEEFARYMRRVPRFFPNLR